MGRKVELSKKTQFIFLMSFVGVFFLIGLSVIICFYTWFQIKNSNVRKNWEQVPCTIVSVNLEHSTNTGRSVRRVGNRRPRTRSNVYYIDGEYTYEYEGKSYTSYIFNFQQEFKTGLKSLVSKIVEEYRTLEEPTCYVNPENPVEAVLDPTVMPASKVPLYVGLGFIAMSILMAIQAMKYKP